MADRPGVPGRSGSEPERAAQLVVVPRNHATAPDAADRRRGQHGGGRLVYAALRIREREHPRAAQIPAQRTDQLLDAATGGRGGLPFDPAGQPARSRTTTRRTVAATTGRAVAA